MFILCLINSLHVWSKRTQVCFLVTINVFVVFCWSPIKIPGFTFLVVETSFRLWLWVHCGDQGKPLSQTQPIPHWQLTNPGSLCLQEINKQTKIQQYPLLSLWKDEFSHKCFLLAVSMTLPLLNESVPGQFVSCCQPCVTSPCPCQSSFKTKTWAKDPVTDWCVMWPGIMIFTHGW